MAKPSRILNDDVTEMTRVRGLSEEEEENRQRWKFWRGTLKGMEHGWIRQHITYIILEELYLLGYNAVQSVENQPTFRGEHVASIFSAEE
jgi:hypothetical protein